MHPIERLRYVARVDDADPALVAIEAGHALAAVAAEDPAGLVPACRRLIEHHPTSGPMWWLAARVLGAPDPVGEAWRSAHLLSEDALRSILARALPDDTTVVIVGWPDATADALRRRGDLEVLVVDGGGEGRALARRLADVDTDMAAFAVADAGVGPAVTVAGLVVIEAVAAGPSGVLARIGSQAAAAVAAHAGVPVWAAIGFGRTLPSALWDALLARFDGTGTEPWDRQVELVPTALVSAVVGSEISPNPGDPARALSTSSAPASPELLRPAG